MTTCTWCGMPCERDPVQFWSLCFSCKERRRVVSEMHAEAARNAYKTKPAPESPGENTKEEK